MKLLRVGEVGHEKIAALDKTNVIRDLSDQIDNLSSNTFNTEYLEKIKKIDLSKQKEISSRTRIGPCRMRGMPCLCRANALRNPCVMRDTSC